MFLFRTTFSFVTIHKKCWGFLYVLAERMKSAKAPLEVVWLPLSSIGKSTLNCLWDLNRKRSISHLAKLLSQAACQYDFRKCSSSAFQAVLQIHIDSWQGAFLSNSESEAYWHRRGRQLVLVISDNLHITRYSLLGNDKVTTPETEGSSFSGGTLLLALLSWYLLSCVHTVFFLHIGNSEYLWESMPRAPLKPSQKRWLPLPLSYFFSEINMVCCRVNFCFHVASAVSPSHGLVTELTCTTQSTLNLPFSADLATCWVI